jgi:methionine aminopeptidase
MCITISSPVAPSTQTDSSDHGGLHGDLNATYPVGKVDQESLDLMATTKKAMEDAIAICKPGVAYREIGNKIEEVIKPTGYSIVRRYTGHGVHHLVSDQSGSTVRYFCLTEAVPLPAEHCALWWLEDPRKDGGWTGLHHSAYSSRG